MFDPRTFVVDSRFGYVMRHERCDYGCSKAPLAERLNPLRLQIGIGRKRPCWLVINKNAWMHRKMSDFLFRLKRGAR
jgi:hypothetical protein